MESTLLWSTSADSKTVFEAKLWRQQHHESKCHCKKSGPSRCGGGVPYAPNGVRPELFQLRGLPPAPQGRRSWPWPLIRRGAKPGDWVEVEPPPQRHRLRPSGLFPPPASFFWGIPHRQASGSGRRGFHRNGSRGLVLGFVPAVLINRTITRRKTPEFTVLGYLHSV